MEMTGFVSLNRMSDPEERAERRSRRESAILRRERLLQHARGLLNQARLSGAWGVPGPQSGCYVMHPETLNFLLRGQTALHEGPKRLAMGDLPTLDGVPVRFSDELDPDQVILAYDGWPYFGPDDLARRGEW